MRLLLTLCVLAVVACEGRSADPEFALKVFASRENGLGYAVERDSKFLGYRWAFGFLAKRTASGLPVSSANTVSAPIMVQPLSVPATIVIPEQRIPATVPVVPASRPVDVSPPPVRVMPATIPCEKPAETLFATLRK